MKNSIAITSTGSSDLATTPVKCACYSVATSVIIFGLALFTTMSCQDPVFSNPITSKSELACGSFCDGRFKMFSRQAVHLEIEPTGERSQVFYNIDPATFIDQPIMLNNTVHITGQALPLKMLPGTVYDSVNHDNSDAFSDILAIPTVNRISFLSPRIPTIKSRLQSDAAFSLDLLSGLSYTLILNPLGLKERAPIHLNTGIIAADNRLDFVMEENPKKLSGTVIFDAEFDPGDERPRMQARLMLGSRLISSVNEIDINGKFALLISQPLFNDAENQPLNLLIEPVDAETALPRIRHKLDLDILQKDFDVGDINIGTLKKPIAATFEVRGGDDSVISNAILYLRATIGAGIAVVTKQVDKSGSTEFARLYNGEYEIAIIPPPASKFGMRVIKNVDIKSKNKIHISFDLEKRETLTAHVLNPLGQDVSGAQIQFSRIGEIGNFATEDIYDDNLFNLNTTTNSRGKACHRESGFSTTDKDECSALLLDEGRYLAHIIPPAGTELAHKWITFDFPERNELSIILDQPEILVGQVVRSDGKTPAARAFVTVFLAETNMHNQPKMIGNAITDEKGYFRAFVSAP